MRQSITLILILLVGVLVACSTSPATDAPVAATAQPTVAPVSPTANSTSTTAAVQTRAPTLTPFPAPTIVIPTPLPDSAKTKTTTDTTTTAPLPATTPVPLLTPSSTTQATLESLRGKIIFRTDREGNSVQLYVMEPDGSDPRLCNCSDVFEALVKQEVTSPDQQQFLFVKNVGGSLRSPADQQIWSHNNRTGYESVVTGAAPGFPGVDYAPTWSPDSRHIAWVSAADGNDEIYLHDTLTGENKRLTENDKAWDKHPSFSPDGSQIVFWSNRDSAVRKQVWVMNLDGSQPHNISNNSYNDYDPIWVK